MSKSVSEKMLRLEYGSSSVKKASNFTKYVGFMGKSSAQH